MTLQETHLQQMLATLRTRLLVMCATVGLAVDDACKALLDGDAPRASAVIDGDAAINSLENEIDEMALSILARTQPVARDLRFVVSTLRMVLDLERIGDEAAGIAERAILMQGLQQPRIMDDVRALMETARKLYADSVAAFREGDLELALAVSRGDDEAAQMEVRIFQRLMQDPDARIDAHMAIHIILIARALNRIWRRAANVAEHTYFILEGVSIKHKKMDEIPREQEETQQR